VHIFLIWIGDILLLYAFLGFIVLLLFRKRRPRTLLIWAAILPLVPLLFLGFATVLIELGRSTPDGAAMIDEVLAQQRAGFLADFERAVSVYSSGSYLEITAQRAYELTAKAVQASDEMIGMANALKR